MANLRFLAALWMLLGSTGPDPRKAGEEDPADLEEPDELSDPSDFDDDPADDPGA